MFIDIAARIAELGRVPYSSRNFFIIYSSKILYGTDCTPINLNLNKKYFRFLETFDEYFEYQEDGETPGQGRWRIYGIGLPDEVLKDIYYGNACKILNLDIKQFE
jgi:predicted TIM-barrel fold metal-dependent hydrolase